MAYKSLTGAARAVLLTANAHEKATLSRKTAEAWRAGAFSDLGAPCAPDRPCRPEKPELLAPRDMPRRRGGGDRARIALLHALAHIELNAIDLAWDMIARFASPLLPEFADDWLTVADEEAKHFLLLSDRLEELGAAYGDLPAHDGLWEAAQTTSNDVLARLAVVPLVLEARGLDVTPVMIEKLEAAGDEKSATILRVIYQDEIGHVGIGLKWFEQLSDSELGDSPQQWKSLVKRHFRGQLKPPFNAEARKKAGFSPAYYENIG